MSTQQIAEADGLTAHVASEIRAMMGRLNVNRAELARRLGVEDSWVGKRLNGRTEISLSDFDRIARALNVGIVDLLPRDARQPTLTYASAPAVTGTTPWPDHPVVAGAVRIPMQRSAGPPGRHSKTYPVSR
jgi:transcriptional regulator with XRE-family HTH domain